MQDAWHSWLDHPAVAAHYRQRALVDGVPWEEWVTSHLGEPPRKSLQLACGSGDKSLFLFERGLSRWVDGVDASEDLVQTGEQRRRAYKAPGLFRVLDLNARTLRPGTYDLVFASHNFHQFVALEHILEQVQTALTPRGVFVIEGYVGPSRFQWTDVQMELARVVMAMMPERLRMFRWGGLKTAEGRPERKAVAAISPLESIRASDIAPLFHQHFQALASRPLGGTIQNLLYNGIIHHFAETDPEACRHIDAVVGLEDLLIDGGLLSSDFQLMIGRRR
jgi:SAM-dependent methyltransferase